MEDKTPNMISRIFSAFKKPEPVKEQVAEVIIPEEVITQTDVKADFLGVGNSSSSSRYLFNVSYNGEKNLGEVGPIKSYTIDYEGLRLRSWQSYLESEITQTVINKFTTWVIGKGLKLQCEPETTLLESEGIKFDSQKFCNITESRFNIYRKSKSSDFANMKNLDFRANEAFKNAIVGGDVLVILRYINNSLKVQLIDGTHIQSPTFGTEWFPLNMPNGHQIINGIEINENGEHVAYYIRKFDFSIKRIEAKGKESGLQMAFLVYGMEYRLNNNRGLPLFSTVLETLKKMERYKEAVVGSAEERQKIAFSIEHDINSTGENPLIKQMANAINYDGTQSDLPVDQQGKNLANVVAATTNKQAYNMPIGSKLQMHDSKNELYFKDFYSVNIDLICAALGIPPEVAMSKYNSNFSASRAALKDWEHVLTVKRNEFAFSFYQPIFNFWLETQILQNKIDAPGYLGAKLKSNTEVLDAYRNARFVGASVPHIDPLKEAKAEREKLGKGAEFIPLTTVEAATENLNGGESDSNISQYAKELEQAKKLKIIPDPPKPIVPPVPRPNP